MSSTVSSTYETHIWSAPSAPLKLHSRAREAETTCCAEFTFTKSLERIEIPHCIYDSCDGLGLLSKDPIGFGAGDTNLYRMTGNHPNMSTDPSGLITEDEWNNSALFNSVRDSGRGHLQKLRGMYFTEQALGNHENADSILDAARVHASLHSGGLHSDHDKFLKHDASVRSMQHGRFGQSVISTSNGLDYVGHKLHEGFEFAVDVKMILSSDAMVEGDQLIEVAPGIYERSRYLSPRETSYDKRILAKMTLQAEIDITLAMLTGGSSFKPGYGQFDDAWNSQILIHKCSPASLRGLRPGDVVPDGLEIIVRGSSQKPGTFILREGIDTRKLGAVSTPGKSATVATDLTLDTEIHRMFGRAPTRGDVLSGGAISDVRAAGFEVIYAPTEANPLHVRIIPKANQFDGVGRDWLSEAFDNLARQKK